MRRVTDSVDYRRDGDHNVLTLTKQIRESEGTGRGRRVVCAGGSLDRDRRRLCSHGERRVPHLPHGVAERRSEFFDRWTEFARTAATSSLQHILNERSDAEFDQLAVGLASTQPSVAYFVIVDDRGEIRADAKTPQRVHDQYIWPDGIPRGVVGHWPTVVGGEDVFHFTEEIAGGPRRVGAIALGVPRSLLDGPVSAERRRVIAGALLILVVGGVVVGGITAGVRRPWRRLVEMLRTEKSPGATPLAGAHSEASPTCWQRCTM